MKLKSVKVHRSSSKSYVIWESLYPSVGAEEFTQKTTYHASNSRLEEERIIVSSLLSQEFVLLET